MENNLPKRRKGKKTHPLPPLFRGENKGAVSIPPESPQNPPPTPSQEGNRISQPPSQEGNGVPPPETQKSKTEGNDISLEKLIRAHKINITRKIQAGETGLDKELEHLQTLEIRQKDEGERMKDENHKSEIRNPKSETETYGLPEHLRIPRRYTMSESAREQRRKAGIAKGKKNPATNWKHGRFAKSYITGAIRPCKSTCSKYPCDIVEEGNAAPGDPCLDKAAVIQTYKAIIDAVKNKKMDNFQDLAALTISQSIQTLNMLLEDIIRDGTMMKREKIDKDGKMLGYDIMPHPSLLALPKMIADLGMTPQEFMITPRQIIKQGTEEEGVKTIADLMSRVGETLRKKQEAK